MQRYSRYATNVHQQFAFALCTCIVIATLTAALALTGAQQPPYAFADDSSGIPCIATEEQLVAYEAEGTLAQRAAFQNELDNDQPSSELIQQAIARQNKENGIATFSPPGLWESGMATSGKAHVLALRVSFPNYAFDSADTLDALQAIIGPRYEGDTATASADPFPYESLSAYYQRASYGKLTITGEVMDYHAQHERDYYTNNVGLLFKEALDALDKSEDLGRFDANSDGRIDAVYLHFAGGDTGWGSVWWSNEQTFNIPDTTYANGKVRLWNGVALATPSHQTTATRTIIHETGHVLGLPDFYQYSNSPNTATNRTGILTFDMMMDNQGDHNGFSKWLTGWISGEKVTRVIANESGVTVKQGQSVIDHADASEGGDAAIQRTLSSFTSDNMAETGGIIVVSNKDEGIFSSYYVLQYDQFAGNQSVQYLARESGLQNIPSGFRLFRVQGALTDGELSFTHTNNSGTVHDQLIELVDPDMNKEHSAGFYTVPSDPTKETYGCMLYAGDSVSPQGYPSTNFSENKNIGFTGLTIAATESKADQGSVTLSYSSADKPDPSESFEITPDFSAFSNVGNLTFTASKAPLFSPDSPRAAQLIIDGESRLLFNVSLQGTKISVPYMLDPISIKPTSSCEIIFPAGMFILSQIEGKTTYSLEVRLLLKPSPSMTLVNQAGFYSGTEHQERTTVLSDVFACEDETRRFFQIADGALKLHTIDSNDAAHITSLTISGQPMPIANEHLSLLAVPLSNEEVFLALLSDEASTSGMGYWIDIKRGAITASCALDQSHTMAFASSGTSVIKASPYYGSRSSNAPGSMLLTMLTPQSDGAVHIKYGWTGAASVAAAGPNTFACSFMDSETAEATQTLIIPVQHIVEELSTSTSDPLNAAEAGETCQDEYAAAKLPLSIERYVTAAQATSAGYYLLLSSKYFAMDGEFSNLIVHFDKEGVELNRVEIPLESNSTYTQIFAAKNGTVALAKHDTTQKNGITRNDVQFLDANGKPLSILTTSSASWGTWLIDGRWISIGGSIAEATAQKGSPDIAGSISQEAEGAGEDRRLKVYFNITTQLDSKPTPGEPVTPAQPNNPQANEQVKALPDTAKTLASTGDRAGITALALTVGAGAAFVIALLLRRLTRRLPRN